MRVNTHNAGMFEQTQLKQRRFVKNLSDRKHNNTWMQYLFGENHEINNKNSIIDDFNNLDSKLIYYQINKFIVCLLNNSIFTNDSESDDNNNNKLKTSDHVDDLAEANLLSSESILSTINEANLLLHNKKTTLTIEETDSKYNFCYKHYYNFKTNNRYRDTRNQNLYFQDKIESKLVKQTRQQLFSLPYLVVLTLLLISNRNAQLCNGFTNPLRNDNIGVIGNHFSHQLSTITPNLNFPSYRNMIRSFNNDPLVIMPSSPDSFTNDETGQPHLSDWTSKLSGAFSRAPQRDSLDMHIENILVPRISGTQDNVKVRQYIVDSLKANNYHVELDEFTDSTPIGKVQFANIIASSNPNACRQLVLACHYDSKMMNGFLGATDSAVPCAMLLKISETFSKQFRDSSQSFKETLGLRFIFFDGEEAFDEWGPKDSLYGSRHLAEKWEKQPSPPQCNGKNELSRIELFVLLDLIGAEDTSFVMYSIPLKHHYNAMQRYEKAYLAKAGLTSIQIRRETMFKGRFVPLDFVEDDHVPFKKRGVPILSLLAHPFPKVWHTVDDNYKAIDFPKTRRVLHVLEEFVANYKKEAN